jgi:hypothetical protein
VSEAVGSISAQWTGTLYQCVARWLKVIWSQGLVDTIGRWQNGSACVSYGWMCIVTESL